MREPAIHEALFIVDEKYVALQYEVRSKKISRKKDGCIACLEFMMKYHRFEKPIAIIRDLEKARA